MAMDPNMLAQLAMQFGGTMAQHSGAPGGTFGSGLGAALAQAPQNIMQYQQAAQMKKMRELQMMQVQQNMAAQQDEQQQQRDILQARQGIGEGMAGPVGDLMGAGDMQGAQFMQQHQQAQAKKQMMAAELQQQQQAQQHKALIEQTKMQQAQQQHQDKMRMEGKKLNLDQQKLQQPDFGSVQTGTDPEGNDYFWRLNKKTGQPEVVPGVNPREKQPLLAGMNIDTKEGKISFGNGGVLPKSTQTEAANKILSSESRINQIDSLLNQTDPKFMQYEGKIKSGVHDVGSKLGISEPDKFVADMGMWKQQAAQVFVEQRHALTGAAGSEKEYAQIAQTIPDPNTDNYTSFIAKGIGAKYMAKRLSERYKKAASLGIDMNDELQREKYAASDPLSNYEGVQSVGDQYEELYTRLNPEAEKEEVQKMVWGQLKNMGYFGQSNPVQGYFQGNR